LRRLSGGEKSATQSGLTTGILFLSEVPTLSIDKWVSEKKDESSSVEQPSSVYVYCPDVNVTGDGRYRPGCGKAKPEGLIAEWERFD
jgi:hypothetical protein